MKPVIERAEVQYLNNLRHIYENGTDVFNERTGQSTRVIINVDQTYDASINEAPIITSRRIPNPKMPIAELLGYIKGVKSAAQMRELGTKTWDANANENKAWLANPARGGEDDLGLIYGGVAKNWPVISTITHPGTENEYISANSTLDLFCKVYNNLKNGIDDRGEIITFWNPGMFHLGCLRPCLYEHQFSLVGDDLYLNSTQRSA